MINIYRYVAPACWSNLTVPEPSLFSAMTPLQLAQRSSGRFKTAGGLYGNHMRENSNKREVDKPTVNIPDSSAPDAADSHPGSDHVGGQDARGG